MAKHVLVNLDMNQNEVQNFRVHSLAVAPATPVEAQMYFNSASDKLFLYVNSAWKDITGLVNSVTSTQPNITFDATDASNITLTIGNANATNAGFLTSAFYLDLTNATDAATANTLVKRDANGSVTFNNVSATSMQVTTVPVNANDVVNKSYVDSLLASGMRIINALDASTNPSYPAAVVGDAYYINAAGKVGGVAGEDVEIGDMIVCVADNAGGDQATVGSSWIVLQDNIGQASETVAGYARIATQVEAEAGVLDNVMMTPLKVKQFFDANLPPGLARSSVATIGNGTNISYTVNHAYANQFVQAQVFDASTQEEVITEVVNTDANNTAITFASAPGVSAYYVVIQG